MAIESRGAGREALRRPPAWAMRAAGMGQSLDTGLVTGEGLGAM